MPSRHVLRKPAALRVLALLLLWASAPIATATIIEIPLPQLNGPLFEGERTRSMPYDLGVEFLDIEYMHVAATVQASPTVLKRLDTQELVYRPGLIGFSISGQVAHEGQMYDVQRFTALRILETDPTAASQPKLGVGIPTVIVVNNDSARVGIQSLLPPGESWGGVLLSNIPVDFSSGQIDVALWGVYILRRRYAARQLPDGRRQRCPADRLGHARSRTHNASALDLWRCRVSAASIPIGLIT